MIVDATDLIVGRMASKVAKRALLGERVDVVNCESAIITGRKETVFKKYSTLSSMGRHSKGPFYPRRSDMFVRRIIRGMLPHKQDKGRDALKRIMCYVGVPDKFNEGKLETFKDTNVSKVPSLYYVNVGDLVKLLGGKK
ncbi:50S ribosomal protein L13 [Nanoarchaeota archaeon]